MIGEAISYKIYHPGVGRLVTPEQFRALQAQSQATAAQEIEEGLRDLGRRREQEATNREAQAKNKATVRDRRAEMGKALVAGKKPVKGWIRKYIETHNGVTLGTIKTLMLEKEYRDTKIEAQIERIRRDYELDGQNIIGEKNQVLEDMAALAEAHRDAGVVEGPTEQLEVDLA